MFTISVAVFQKKIRYKKLIYSILFGFYAYFLYLQILSIIENETTLRIITHTKLNISYILFSLVCFLLLINRGKPAFYFWLIAGVQGILYYLSFNLTGTGFNESIPFHLKTGIKGAGIGDFYKLIIDITLLVALFIFSAFFCFKKIIKKETKEKTINAKIPVFLMLVLLVFNPLNYDIYQTYKVVDEDPKFLFKDNYQPPKQPVKNETKYNLVWIYAEAFERIYLNQEIFPDLAPNLAQLEKESLSFSNVHQGVAHSAESSIDTCICQLGYLFECQFIIETHFDDFLLVFRKKYDDVFQILMYLAEDQLFLNIEISFFDGVKNRKFIIHIGCLRHDDMSRFCTEMVYDKIGGYSFSPQDELVFLCVFPFF